VRFEVRVLPHAEKELLRTIDWIRERSVRAAERYCAAFEEALVDLADDPQRFPLAFENDDVVIELKQCLFGTPRGRKHRIVFTTVGNEVRILHVRGPSQDRIDPAHVRYE
jgi:plasmid stabilization system protein ParE